MTVTSVPGQVTFADRSRPFLTRNLFVAMLIVISACAGSAWNVTGVVGVPEALIRGFMDHKVLWVCLGISVWHLMRDDSPAIRGAHLVASLPALVLVAMAGGIWPWVGLCVSLYLLLVSRGKWGAARTGILIALVAAIHVIVLDLLGELGGDAVLSAEAGIAGFLASWIWSDVQVQGTALQLPGGHMLVLVWGCSALSNLGDAMLLFWALASVSLSGPIPRQLMGRFVGCAMLLACITIVLNTLRLVLMACEPGLYAYLHSGQGAVFFRLAILGVTAAMSMAVRSR